jgi:hypothetical protein
MSLLLGEEGQKSISVRGSGVVDLLAFDGVGDAGSRVHARALNNQISGVLAMPGDGQPAARAMATPWPRPVMASQRHVQWPRPVMAPATTNRRSPWRPRDLGWRLGNTDEGERTGSTCKL